MRITTGIYKGRNIGSPKGIRPTQDKVRKALFDILGGIEGLSFLDLFAGSGAVGIEALSRGAKEAMFVESNPVVLKALRENLDVLKCGACSVWQCDCFKAIEKLDGKGRQFDIVFFDPPYYRGLAKKTLQTLSVHDILTPNAFIIAQHFKKDNLPVLEGDLTLLTQRGYGDTWLSLYKNERLFDDFSTITV